MILHVAELEKFIPPFVDFVKQEFSGENHRYWISGDIEKYPIDLDDNFTLCGSTCKDKLFGYAKLVKELCLAEKIVLHGLSNIRIVVLLAFLPWLHKKCYWVLWGSDLYVKRNAVKTMRWRFKEVFRTIVIRRLHAVVTTVPGDYKLVRSWYSTRAKFIHSLMYKSHVARPGQMAIKRGVLNIQIGNSSDPENRHAELFYKLHKIKSKSICDANIYCPLSYGDEEYAKDVIALGKKLFGEKFFPLTDFMSFQDYNDYMASIDVAIFNHRRQQAMGNIIGLLSMGKTVYLSSKETPYGFFTDIGVKVYPCELLDEKVELLSDSEKENNLEIIRREFSWNALVDSWRKVFDE